MYIITCLQGGYLCKSTNYSYLCRFLARIRCLGYVGWFIKYEP